MQIVHNPGGMQEWTNLIKVKKVYRMVQKDKKISYVRSNKSDDKQLWKNLQIIDKLPWHSINEKTEKYHHTYRLISK